MSYITWLVEGGATVKTCQDLARHSTPVLTIGTYARMSLHDQGKALAGLPGALPAIPTPERQTMKATGTDDVSANPPKSCATRAQHSDGELELRMADNGEQEKRGVTCDQGEQSPVNIEETQQTKGIGRGRIRTCVGISQRIYSPPLLAAQAHALI